MTENTCTNAHRSTTPEKKNRRHLTFNLVFGQVHRGAVREDVGDGADAPVHQRGGDWVHRHDCDLRQPPAPASRTNVYRENANFPPRSPRQLGSESMDGGRGARRETARGSAAWPPICSLQDERAEENCRCVRELLLPHCSIVLEERRIKKKTSSCLMRKVSWRRKLPQRRRCAHTDRRQPRRASGSELIGTGCPSLLTADQSDLQVINPAACALDPPLPPLPPPPPPRIHLLDMCALLTHSQDPAAFFFTLIHGKPRHGRTDGRKEGGRLSSF